MKQMLISCSLILVLAGCTDMRTGEYVSRLDSLQNSLDEIRAGYEELDTTKLAEANEGYQVLLEQTKHRTDTLDKETVLMLDTYFKSMRKIQPLMENRMVIDQNIVNETEEIGHLRNDIRNAFGKRQNYDEYIRSEEAKVDSIKELYKEVLADYTAVLDIYSQHTDALMERLRTTNTQE